MILCGGSDVKRWYAAVVRPNHEKMVSVALRNKGIEEFTPLYCEKRRWSDRVKQVELPLFPGYVFCRFAIEAPVCVVTTPGVVSLVGFGKGPAPIPDAEIRAIRTLIASGSPLFRWPYLRVGQRVRITDGALQDVEGILVKIHDEFRLVVSIELLQRSVAVTLEGFRVVPVPNPSPNGQALRKPYGNS